MAGFEVNGLDALMLSLQEVEALPEHLQDEILNAQADALIPELQERGRAYGVEDSGKMLKSIKKGKVRRNKNGRYIVVSPRGTRRRGGKSVSNSEIAFLNNYGTRHQSARPFWTDTTEISAKTLFRIAERHYDEWLKSLNL